MKIKHMMSVIHQRMSGEKVFWMKNEGQNCISVVAQVPSTVPMRRDSDVDKIKIMATRAENTVLSIAKKAGVVGSHGVLMGSNGKGSLIATGFAELPDNQEVESRLESSGVYRIR